MCWLPSIVAGSQLLTSGAKGAADAGLCWLVRAAAP